MSTELHQKNDEHVKASSGPYVLTHAKVIAYMSAVIILGGTVFVDRFIYRTHDSVVELRHDVDLLQYKMGHCEEELGETRQSLYNHKGVFKQHMRDVDKEHRVAGESIAGMRIQIGQCLERTVRMYENRNGSGH